MEIRLNKSYNFYNVQVKDTNVLLDFDATDSEFIKDENGKNRHFKNDVSDEALNIFTTVTEDLIYYREKEYDSSNLILQLFDKLGEEGQDKLLKQLNEDYGEI